MIVKTSNANLPNWREIKVKPSLPEALKKLDEIAHNIWWSWNLEGKTLFRNIDPELWFKSGHNPVLFLDSLNYDKLEELSKDQMLIDNMNSVYNKFRTYIDEKPDTSRPSVAYFCMEYGLSHVLKIYSGGLGVLAGDYMKEASDSNVDMCGVGFLYRYGYFTQNLSIDGQQVASYEPLDFGSLPLEIGRAHV